MRMKDDVMLKIVAGKETIGCCKEVGAGAEGVKLDGRENYTKKREKTKSAKSAKVFPAIPAGIECLLLRLQFRSYTSQINRRISTNTS